ncbi:hypothetical protein AUP68_10999 [Ilyonectria robusta]
MPTNEHRTHNGPGTQISSSQLTKLDQLGLYFNSPEPAIICKECGYAITADKDRVSRHLGEIHQVDKAARRGLNKLIRSLNLPDPKDLCPRPDGSIPHPHLKCINGSACKFCGIRSTSDLVLESHLRKSHAAEIKLAGKSGHRWLRDYIQSGLIFQSWTAQGVHRSWIVGRDDAQTPARQVNTGLLLQKTPDPVKNFAQQLLAEERERLDRQVNQRAPHDASGSMSSTLFTNWMRRTGWQTTFGEARRDILVSLSALPCNPNRPLRLGDLDEETLYSPARQERRLVLMVAALDRLFDRCADTEVGLNDPAVDVLLRFGNYAMTENFEDGTASSTMLVYFSAVRGLSPLNGDEYLQPNRFTPILARLIYCTRLILLESVLPCRPHSYVNIPSRPRYGQLKALNAVRTENMCDGTLSPMGEFLSLLSYGHVLRRSQGPAIHFHWSDDGEILSWDGIHQLSMESFRGLAHTALEAATARCRRLMYEWEPDEIDLRHIRDRISTTTQGYSFVTDPANSLEGLHLDLFMRVCISPIDGLLKTYSKRESTWDFASAQAYLVAHDDLLRTLMYASATTLLFTPISQQGQPSSSTWTASIFTQELRRCCALAPGVPPGIGTQLYRQVSIAITERHVSSASSPFNRFDDHTSQAAQDVAYAWQSGHRPMQRHVTYGLDGAYPDHLQPSLLRIYERVSRSWHAFLWEERQQESCHVYDLVKTVAVPSCDTGRGMQLLKRHYEGIETLPQPPERQLNTKQQRIASPLDRAPKGGDADLYKSAAMGVDILLVGDDNEDTAVFDEPSSSVAAQEDLSDNPGNISSLAMGPFVFLPQVNLVVYTHCRYCVIVAHIDRHLRQPYYRRAYTGKQQCDIISKALTIPNIIKDKAEL